MQHVAASDDLPGSRRSIESVATKGNTYAVLTLAMLGVALFLAGLVQSRQVMDKAVDALPQPLVFMCVGMVDFALFFPFSVALYYSRHLLVSVKRLEAENAELRRQITAVAERVA